MGRGGKRAKKRKYLITECMGFILSLIVIVPFLLIILNSFKDLGNANRLEMNFDGISLSQIIENYTTVFVEADLLSSMLNSLIVTVFSVTFIVIFSSLAAFVIVRRKTRAMNITNNLIIAGLTLPAAMVPTYYMLSKMHMSTGPMAMLGAIMVYTAVNFAFAFFLYTGFIKSLPEELDEAAIVDGVTPLGLFFRIILPLLKPATVTVIISEALTVWNDFNISLYLLNSPERSTAVLTTYLFMGQRTSQWNLLFADVVMVSLPIIILYFCLQKYIVAGLTSGAVKG